MNIYLIPGQGADHRLFSKLQLDASFNIHHITFEVPKAGYLMPDYARQLSKQIDTSQPYILLGVSIGGMLATEMTDFLNPVKTIVVSSAKSKNEIPLLYTIQSKLNLHKLIPGWFSKIAALILQPFYEPISKKEKELFKQMIKDKDPVFMRRTINMIVNWDRTTFNPSIIAIHGNSDNTLPIRHVQVDHLVDKGSHLMILTKAEELSHLINKILSKDNA